MRDTSTEWVIESRDDNNVWSVAHGGFDGELEAVSFARANRMGRTLRIVKVTEEVVAEV